MVDERETAIRNETNLLAGLMMSASGEASVHLARLVQADRDQCLFWYASELAKVLGIEAGEVYQAMQQAARSLVKAGDVGIEGSDKYKALTQV